MSQTDERSIAVLSYITIIGWIIAFVLHSNNTVKSSFAAFHLRQALGFYLVALLLGIVGGIFAFMPLIGHLTWVLTRLLIFAGWIYGLYYAAMGEERPIPFIGTLAQQWFARLI